MFGIWGYVAAGIAALVIIGGATHYADSIYYNSTINSMKAEKASEDSARTAAALKQFTDIANTMHASALAFTNTQNDLNLKLATISKDLADVQAKTPLPKSCHPDAARLRLLTAAVAAANSAIRH